MNMSNIRIFGIGSSKTFADRIVQQFNRINLKDFLGLLPHFHLNKHHEERRPDGEAYTTSLDNVRGCDVFVVSSIYSDEVESVDEKFVKTAIFINTLRHASAARITLICPYLPYMRQDRKTESRAPIATQAIAMMLESVGMDRLLTMDVHNLGAEQNAFRIPIDNLEARKLLSDAVISDIGEYEKNCHRDCLPINQWKVLAPDAGGVARAKAFQYSLSKRYGEDIDMVYADKTRINANETRVNIVGDVQDYNVIAVDDMISTGGTLAEINRAVKRQGGVLWGVAATHGLYVNGAPNNLERIPRIYITNTVRPVDMDTNPLLSNITVVETDGMFAEAIYRIHFEGGSISELLED